MLNEPENTLQKNVTIQIRDLEYKLFDVQHKKSFWRCF